MRLLRTIRSVDFTEQKRAALNKLPMSSDAFLATVDPRNGVTVARVTVLMGPRVLLPVRPSRQRSLKKSDPALLLLAIFCSDCEKG